MLIRQSLFAALSLSALAAPALAADELLVYSARIDELIKPVFDAYTAKTGTPIKFITDKEAPLLARLKAEVVFQQPARPWSMCTGTTPPPRQNCGKVWSTFIPSRREPACRCPAD